MPIVFPLRYSKFNDTSFLCFALACALLLLIAAYRERELRFDTTDSPATTREYTINLPHARMEF